MGRLLRLIHEVHRRSLWQVLGIYLLASWPVLGGVGTLADALGLPEWFPRLAVGLLVVGLPIVLATAFVQEGRGGDRAQLEDEAPSTELPRSSVLTWRNALGGVVVAFAVWGVVAAGWVLLAGPPSASGSSEESLAVLPFVNMSGDSDNEYFSDGITEELLNALAQLPGLRVPARTSSFAFKGRNISVTAIADTLDVAHILEGSVRRVGDRVLITAQLVDAETDTHLWSATFERELVDVFAIQRDIAIAIAGQLEVALGRDGSETLVTVATSNSEAYDSYLRGKEYWNRPGTLRPNFEAAIALFERAVALDPDFAVARAALSIAHSAMTWPDYGRYDRSVERLATSAEEARRALDLQPNLAEAHMAMGYVHYWGSYDLHRGLAEFDVAQRLRPKDVEILEARAFVHRRLGNWLEVFSIFEQAVALDPRDANLFWNLGGLSYRAAGRHKEAIGAYRRAIQLAPDQRTWRVQLGQAYVYEDGQIDSLRAALDDLPDESFPIERRTVALYAKDTDRLLAGVTGQNSPADILFVGYAHRLRGNEEAARLRFDSVRVMLEPVVAEAWADYAAGGGVIDFRAYDADRTLSQPLITLGLAYAGLGRRGEAAAAAARILELARIAPYRASQRRTGAARVFAQAGFADQALELLEELAATPVETTPHGLRLDPSWDPIREHPRFRALLASTP